MAEIAEMMLDGTLCEGCGVYLGEACDFTRRCASCSRDERAANHLQTLARQQQVKKVPCPTCGRKVKRMGMAQHIRDAHGDGPPRKAVSLEQAMADLDATDTSFEDPDMGAH